MALLAEKRKIEPHQQLFDELKHRVQILMKDTERVVFMEGLVTWKKVQGSIGLNSQALLKRYPAYLEQFPQTKAGTRRFQIYPNGI